MCLSGWFQKFQQGMHHLCVRWNSLQWLIMLSQLPNVVTMWLHSVITWAQIYALLAIYTLTTNPTGERVLLHCVSGKERHCSTGAGSSDALRENNSNHGRKFRCVRSMRSIITSLAHSLLSHCREQLSVAPTWSQQRALSWVQSVLAKTYQVADDAQTTDKQINWGDPK